LKVRDSYSRERIDGPSSDGIEALVSLFKGLYKLKGQIVRKIWAVFAGRARMIDSFD
jgi:hypothetical protein